MSFFKLGNVTEIYESNSEKPETMTIAELFNVVFLEMNKHRQKKKEKKRVEGEGPKQYI